MDILNLMYKWKLHIMNFIFYPYDCKHLHLLSQIYFYKF